MANQQDQIDDLQKDMDKANAGIALAVAMAQHQFNPESPNAQMSMAGGYFQNKGGFSIAAGAPIVPGEVFANGSVGVTTEGDTAFGASVTIILK